MVEMILFIVSLVGFAFSCRFFLKAVITPVPIFNTSGFSKSALRLQKSYTACALGVMTALFLSSLVLSMIEVYFTL